MLLRKSSCKHINEQAIKKEHQSYTKSAQSLQHSTIEIISPQGDTRTGNELI
jgi:phage FluMu protein Com